MSVLIHKSDAMRAAAKQLPFKSRKKITDMCDFAGLDPADAYICGAEEAQREIVNRLDALRTRITT